MTACSRLLASPRAVPWAVFCAVCILTAGCTAARRQSAPETPACPAPEVKNSWEDSTAYRRQYHVSQLHLQASDKNPGTAELPFKTINRAASLLRPGERVIVHRGIYRERVAPARGGSGPSQMISYEAAPGEQVAVRGSEVYSGPWEMPKRSRRYSSQLWMANIADCCGETAFFKPNLSPEQFAHMEWITSWRKWVPYTSPRGLVFQDGRRLTQLACYEDLPRVEGSYWVDTRDKVLHVHPYGGVPDRSTWELAVREFAFAPEQPGLGWIRISGIAFEHTAGGFPRPQQGAVSTMRGRNWIIEDNAIREANGICLDIGDQWDWRHEEPFDHGGSHIVRRNEISHCGIGGIAGHNAGNMLIVKNRISDIGWHDVERCWETGAIKLHLARNVIIAGNTFRRLIGAPAIWLDYETRNTTVHDNVITDGVSVMGAVVIEASREPNLVQSNLIHGFRGNGVYLRDSDNQRVSGNFFAELAGFAVYAEVPRPRVIEGREATARGNIVSHNAIGAPENRSVFFQQSGNSSDCNLILSSDSPPPAGEVCPAEVVRKALQSGLEPECRDRAHHAGF